MKSNDRLLSFSLLLFLSLFAVGCGADDQTELAAKGNSGAESGGAEDGMPSGECGKTQVSWSNNGEGGTFDYTDAWAEEYEAGSKRGYQIVLTNYPRAEFNPYRDLTGEKQNLLINFFNDDSSAVTPGTYTYVGAEKANQSKKNIFSVTLWSADGALAPTVVDQKELGTMTVVQVDDQTICGSFDVESESGMTFNGTFNLPVEKSRY